ncbi:hypothetical protein Tco_0383416 [Tanacetum coccineum]
MGRWEMAWVSYEMYYGGGLARKQWDWAFKVFTVFIVILLGFPGPSDGLRLHPIVFFSSGSGLTADSSVLTLTLAFLDFGLDSAQSFPFHAQSQQPATRNRGKAIVNSHPPTYDQEPTMVAEDDKMSKEKEIDKLMALISLSFKKIYKPTNNNLRTLSNIKCRYTCGAAVWDSIDKWDWFDLSLRINPPLNCKKYGHVARECQKPKRAKDAAYHKEKMLLCKQEEAGIQLSAEQADWRDDTDDEPGDQELEAHYMYMAQIQEVTLNTANFGPIFDAEPLQKVQNDDDEQDEHNIIIDSLDMSHDREQDDPDDDDDIAKNQSHEQLNNDKVWKQKESTSFQELNVKYFEIQDLKAQLQDKDIPIIIPTTSVSRPQLKSNRLEDRVMHNNKPWKKQQVKDHRRNFKVSNNKTSVTACNLNAKTSHVNFICVTFSKCVLNDNHDMCVLHFINGVNSRTKMPIFVPISTREPKRTMNQSATTPLKRIVAAKSTNQKPRSKHKKQYEQISKTCKWWYSKFTPPGYQWKPKSSALNVKPNLIEIILFIVDSRCSKHMMGNLKLLSNFVEKLLGTVKFRNAQIAPILGYGDLVQGNVTIKRVYYVEGLNHNLFSFGQFCDADLKQIMHAI